MLKKLFAILTAAMLLMASGCGNKPEEKKEEKTQTSKTETSNTETVDKNEEKAEEKTEAATTNVYENKIFFTIEMENGDVMKGELYPDLAPETVDNFVSLCDADFYKGLIFHRVIPGFMIQGGGYDADMNEKDAESIKGEFDSNGFKNPLKHTRGVLSMARTNVKNSASSQFFIMHETSPHLDGEYAAFGRVTEGLEVIDKIAEVETGVYQNMMSDVPVEPQVIKTIRIDR